MACARQLCLVLAAALCLALLPNLCQAFKDKEFKVGMRVDALPTRWPTSLRCTRVCIRLGTTRLHHP